MGKPELRFAVRDGDRCAASWKLWTEPSARQCEVYLACRELSGELKVSMHEKGGWHVAHSKTYYENEVKGYISRMTSRFSDKWQRPAPLFPGLTHAIQIVTPWWSVSSPVKAPDEKKGLVWIPNAAIGMVTLTSLFFMTPTGSLTGDGMHEVGSIPVDRTGEVVRVIRWTASAADMGSPPRGMAEAYRDKGPEDVINAKDLRMIGFGKGQDGALAIFDVAVRAISVKRVD